MAQGNSLTITVGADTAKLRADLAQAQVIFRDAQRSMNEAAKQGQAARVQEMAQTAQSAAQQVVRLSQQVREGTRAAVTGIAVASTASLREITKHFGELAHAAGLPIEGLRALRFGLIGLAGVEVVRGLNAVSDRLTALSDISKQTRFSTDAIQTFTRAVVEGGGSTELANRGIQALSGHLQEAQKQALEAGKALGGPAVLRGGVKDLTNNITNFGKSSTEVFHGAQANIKQFQDNLRALGIDISRVKFDKAGVFDPALLPQIASAINQLARSGRIQEANLRTQGLLNGSYNEWAKALATVGDAWDQVHVRANRVTDEQLKANEAYKIALNELSAAFTDLSAQIGALVFPEVTKFFDDLTKGIGDSIQQVKTLVGWINTAWNALKGLGSAVASVRTGAANTPPETAGGFASGGLIRGPGSDTSDSILARLSNGEFVINAASVRRLGSGFLDSLNTFAMGGLVGTVPQFAAGGLAASSTTPVNLHIGGGVFPTSATPAVAHALVIEAKRQQMSSAGTKPSWYGR